MAAQDPREYLVRLGTGDVVHNSGTDFFQHLVGVHDVLRHELGAPELALAGLYHSIYGTEGFDAFTVPLDKRQEIRGLIGEAAEFTCYVNCVMDRATLDASLDAAPGSHAVRARAEVGGAAIPLTDGQFRNLIAVHLADWLQQVEMEAAQPNARHGWARPGDAWGYRRGAYRHMAELLDGAFLRLYDQTFAREPAETRGIHQRLTPPAPAALAPVA